MPLTSSQFTLPPPHVLKPILYACVFIPVLPLSAQYLVITYKGKESEKEYVCIYIYTHICITASLCCTPETNMIL